MDSIIRLASYNCNSLRSKFENVRFILSEADILLLQELQLCKSDLPLLNDLNEKFDNIANVTDRESEGITEGRPSRGVAILWKKYLSPFISPLIIDDSVIGIILQNDVSKILVLNVYMPCNMQTLESLENYRSMLGKLEVIVREQSVSNIIVTGDFNADPKKGKFWDELCDFIKSFSFLVLDNEQLPQDTFTYLCPAKSVTSWLDHILCSKQLQDCISNIYVNYNFALYDHFPLYFSLKYKFDCVQNITTTNNLENELVNWSKIKDQDRKAISCKLDALLNNLNFIDEEVLHCSVKGCKNISHKKRLNEIFLLMKDVLFECTSDYKFTKNRNYKLDGTKISKIKQT